MRMDMVCPRSYRTGVRARGVLVHGNEAVRVERDDGDRGVAAALGGGSGFNAWERPRVTCMPHLVPCRTNET
jgi:hypothetical protein